MVSFRRQRILAIRGRTTDVRLRTCFAIRGRLAFGADSSHLHAAELRIPGRTGNSGTATRHDAWCTVCCMRLCRTPEPLGTRDCVKVTPRRKCARIRDSKLSLAGAALSARVSARRPPALCPLAVWLCSHGARMHTRRPEQRSPLSGGDLRRAHARLGRPGVVSASRPRGRYVAVTSRPRDRGVVELHVGA
jgi:hypothetical protein